MVAEVFAGLGAIKTALDIAKGLKDISDAAARDVAVVELTEKILAAREAQSTLLDRVSELENRSNSPSPIGKLIRSGISLPDIGGRRRRSCAEASDEQRRGHSTIFVPTALPVGGRESYLQPHIRGPYYDQYKCNGCSFEIGINKGTPPQPDWQGIDD